MNNKWTRINYTMNKKMILKRINYLKWLIYFIETKYYLMIKIKFLFITF